MRLHVLSDLHIEFGAFSLPDVDADILILAGDIGLGTAGIEWAARAASGRPVVYVPGNHEFYDGNLDVVSAAMRQRARELGVHLLERDEFVLNGVRFLGTTLWTDFKLYQHDQPPRYYMEHANRHLTDFQVIRFGSENLAFRASNAVPLHEQAVSWLRERLAVPTDSSTVVVTHHCPHPRSVHERFIGSPLSPAFCSDLSAVIEEFQPRLWVHGHAHDSFDYTCGGTRVVCNPRGYFGHEINPSFQGDLVIEL